MLHKKVRRIFYLFLFFASFVQYDSFAQQNSSPAKKHIILNAAERFQTIDGFGTNINPAYWMNGKLKPVLDSLVKDLGSTWLRFDCYGRANWLDPSKQLPDGHFP